MTNAANSDTMRILSAIKMTASMPTSVGAICIPTILVVDDETATLLDMVFSGRSINLKTVFEMLGVTRYIKIFSTETEAVASFRD